SNKFKCSENLWDGFDLLVKRTEHDLMVSKNILNFFKKKAELEEQHSKKLEKLALKTLASIDESSTINAISFNNSWKKIINSAMMESEQHTLLNTSYLNKICQPLQAMIKDMETKRKKILQEGIKLKQDMKDMVDALKKSQLKYEKANRDLESSRIELKEYKDQCQQQGGASDSDLNNIAKIERRTQRCEAELHSCDEEYREQIKATNDFQNFYNTEAMPKILNDFENFIILHSHFSKSYFSSLVNVLLDLPPAFSNNYDIVKKSVEMIDNNNDVQEFIRKNLMRKQLAQPFQYEPYVEGKLTKKTVSLTWNTKILSQFSRSATNNSPNTSNGNLNTYISGVDKNEPILPTASYKVSLEELMAKQRDTHPHLEVPYVLTVLAENITKLKGHVTEGIFRVPGIISTIKAARIKIDQGDFDLSAIDDVRTSSALLKQWLRDIPTALVPDSLYQAAVDTPSNAVNIVKNIPPINQKVLYYLINFLQIFTKFEFVAHSKMGVSNLSMVFAPTILRCPSVDPNVMLNNVNNERLFVENLIKNIPPPTNVHEFLGLPVQMSDAVKDADDIEELNEDLITSDDEISNKLENSNSDNNNSNSNDNNFNGSDDSNKPISPNNLNDSFNNNLTLNKSNENITISATTTTTTNSAATSSSSSTSTTVPTSPTSAGTTTTSPGFSAVIRPSRPQPLGWVRVKPAAAGNKSSSPSSSLSSSPSTTTPLPTSPQTSSQPTPTEPTSP
ncbi:hypothetical protein DICPUDRAFT_15662, partial [Dictyostelium purpureum]